MSTLLHLACAALAALLPSTAVGFQDAPPKPVWNQAELESLAAQIQAEIEDIRGEPYAHPVAVKVADRDTLIRYMKERTEQDEPPAKLAADQRVAKLLGMIPPDMDLLATEYALLEDQVAGFYDPPTKTFYLMDSMPKGIAGAIIAHELVHALDDQLYDLDATIKELGEDSDAALAFRCLVEGSGTNGGNVWTLRHLDQIDSQGLQSMQAEQNASLAAAPAWLWKPLVGAYLDGSAFLVRSNDVRAGQAAGASNADIDHAFRNRPRSTEQVLHPEKYWDAARRDDPITVELDLSDLPSGWEVRRVDTLGELLLAMVASPRDTLGGLDLSTPEKAIQLLTMTYTNTAAEGWGGDALVLLGKGDASWLRLVTVWDTERDAGEFYATMQTLLPDLKRSAKAVADGLDLDGESDAELAYGGASNEVVLTVWSGARGRDAFRLDRNVTRTME